MAYWLESWIPDLGNPGSSPLSCSMVDWTFHFSKVDQMSTKNSWGLSGQKQTIFLWRLCSLEMAEPYP